MSIKPERVMPPRSLTVGPLEAHLGLAQEHVERVDVHLEGQLCQNQVAQQSLVYGDRNVLHGEHGLPPLEAADRFAQTLDLALEDHLLRAQLAPTLVTPAATSGRGQGRPTTTPDRTDLMGCFLVSRTQ
jgi:hypothetical protein